MLVIIFILFAAFNLAVSIICAANVSESAKNAQTTASSVSIIIPGRNEDHILPECLNSLKNISYNRDRLEIILVNDRSDDETGNLMKAFSLSNSHAKTLTIKNNNSGLSGKTHAVEAGVAASSGDMLFFTDADCIVPDTWIPGLAGNTADPQTIYAGFVYPEPAAPSAASRLFESLQCIDWIRFCTIGMAWSRLGKPLSIFGNNFAVSRKMYDKAGGVSTGGFHHTEDYAFMNAAVHKGADVLFSLSRESAVRTAPVVRFRDLIRQRMRWALGSKNRGFWSHILLASVIVLFWTSATFVLWGRLTLGISGFCVLILCDAILLVRPLRVFNKIYLLALLPLFECFFSLYTVCTVIALAVKRNVLWKNETMETSRK